MVTVSGVGLPVVPSTSSAETPAVPTAPTPASVQSTPAPVVDSRGGDVVVISPAVQSASSAAASDYILGDKSFTIFEDASGKLITRYRSLRDGSISYIPKPDVTGFSAKAKTAPEYRSSSVKIDV